MMSDHEAWVEQKREASGGVSDADILQQFATCSEGDRYVELFKKKTVIGTRGEELPIPNEGLPDSHTLSELCPRCGKQSSFENIGFLPATFDSVYMEKETEPQNKHLLIGCPRYFAVIVIRP